MGAVAWVLASISVPLALLASVVAYLLALLILRVLTPEELALLAPLLPARLRGFVTSRAAFR